jgi:hypothetical protein
VHQGTVYTEESHKAQAIFDHFDAIRGTAVGRTQRLNFDLLEIPSLQLPSHDQCFSEEVWSVIRSMPADKAPRLDGFTGLFYQSAWPIIEGDIMQAFHSLWVLDSWSFYLINQAYMILLLQGEREATKVKDFRPISLIHSLSKLIAKVL